MTIHYFTDGTSFQVLESPERWHKIAIEGNEIFCFETGGMLTSGPENPMQEHLDNTVSVGDTIIVDGRSFFVDYRTRSGCFRPAVFLQETSDRKRQKT